MKKIEMREKVELNKVMVALKNFQNSIMKANPDDGRLSTLKEIQQKVQTCLEGKNIIPVEDLKIIQALLREDMQNNGDFKVALEKVEYEMVDRTMNGFLAKVEKERREVNPYDQYIREPEPAAQDDKVSTASVQEVTNSPKKPLPVAPQRAPLTSAQRIPAPPTEHNSNEEVKGRARAQMISRGQPLTVERLISSNPNSTQQLGRLARSLLNQSQQQKTDPQKRHLLNAFEELSKMKVNDAVLGAIIEAKKDLTEGKTTPDVLRKFLKSVIEVKKPYFTKDQTLKNFLNTEGMQTAIKSDASIRGALRQVATNLPVAAKKIITSALPEQTTPTMKRA